MQFTNVFKQETLFRILILMTLPLDDIRTYQKSATKSRIAHIWTWLIFVSKQIHRISHPLMIGRCCRSNVLPTPGNYLKKTFQWRLWLVKRKKILMYVKFPTMLQVYCKLSDWYWKIMGSQLWILTSAIERFLLLESDIFMQWTYVYLSDVLVAAARLLYTIGQ